MVLRLCLHLRPLHRFNTQTRVSRWDAPPEKVLEEPETLDEDGEEAWRPRVLEEKEKEALYVLCTNPRPAAPPLCLTQMLHLDRMW